MKRKIVLFFAVLLMATPLILSYFQNRSKAAPTKASIQVNTRKITHPLQENWKALAQGGEQKTRMLGDVVPQITELSPKYIRIDHIYDFYDVVSRDTSGNIIYDWTKLDETVCDILQTGAKPFFSLSYMPTSISSDGSLIAPPQNWEDWANLVQKTVERYSGRGTVICGGAVGHALTNIYYEVWNEPDLEQFGKWSIYNGEKDYKTLYYYSAIGAGRAERVNEFSLGGPAITAAYRNWFQNFLKYIAAENLRIDFISWHHYTKDPDDYREDIQNINSWIPQEHFGRFASLPKIISEWGYDSTPNPVADTEVGAAYTIAALRNLVDPQLTHAFSFEVKDGLNPSWGILSQSGEKKPRYYALQLMNLLEGYKIDLQGEGTFVKGIASTSQRKTTVILANYDESGQNTENVPVTFNNLSPATYTLTTTYLNKPPVSEDFSVGETTLVKDILMPPNAVVALELVKK